MKLLTIAGFNLFDYSNAGFINSADLESALIAVGYFVTESELETVCLHLDIETTSKIDFSLFMSVLAHQMVDRSDVQIMEAFRIFDKEGKGTIGELILVRSNIGENNIGENNIGENNIGENNIDKEQYWRGAILARSNIGDEQFLPVPRETHNSF